MITRTLIAVIAREFAGCLATDRGNLSFTRQIASSALSRFAKWTGLLAMTAWMILPAPAHGAFEDTGTGARGAALGSNYVSMGDDVLSLMYNPATLARVHEKELTSEYSRLYMGLTDGSNLSQTYFGYGQPIAWAGRSRSAGSSSAWTTSIANVRCRWAMANG